MRFRSPRCEHVCRELLSTVRLRRQRQRLRWRGDFPGYVATRISALRNWKQGLAGTSIEEIHESLLRGLSDCIYRTPSAIYREECRRRRKIAVPDIVMYSLEMPNAFTR